MKNIKIFVMATLLCCTSITAFGQDNSESNITQAALDAHQQKIVYRAQLAEDVKGWRMGAEYSLRRMFTAGARPATKHGIHFLGGYRFTKRWYVGGIVGIGATTPFTIADNEYQDDRLNYSISRKDKIYGTLMADARFYMSINKVSTYLFTNFGVEYSKELQKALTIGLGLDVHTTKSQCVNIGLGVGFGTWYSTDSVLFRTGEDPNLWSTDGFALNLKLGYTF